MRTRLPGRAARRSAQSSRQATPSMLGDSEAHAPPLVAADAAAGASSAAVIAAAAARRMILIVVTPGPGRGGVPDS
jgi:hypothetical protein